MAEGLQLADEVAGLALLVNVGVVPAGAEVAEAGFGAGGGQKMMTGMERAIAARGLAFPAPSGQAAVALAGEGIGAGGGGGGLPGDAAQPGAALAGPAGPVPAMMAWAAMTPQPVISSSRATAGKITAPGPVPVCGPAAPSASTPQAAGISGIQQVTIRTILEHVS